MALAIERTLGNCSSAGSELWLGWSLFRGRCELSRLLLCTYCCLNGSPLGACSLFGVFCTEGKTALQKHQPKPPAFPGPPRGLWSNLEFLQLKLKQKRRVYGWDFHQLNTLREEKNEPICFLHAFLLIKQNCIG